MKIISSFDRDRRLKALYDNKELLCFVNGKVWFESKLDEIWLAYYDHVNMPQKWRTIGIDKSKWEYYNL